MKLSISIMMHPKRKEFLPYLQERLGVWPVALDEGCGLIQNCYNAWSLYDPTADYHAVIQDDCIVCKDFYNRATEQIERAGGLPVSFFYSQSQFYKKHKPEREQTGAITKKSLYGGLAIALPTKLIPAMLEYYKKLKIPFDDHRINLFCMANKINIYSPFPNLIDHRDGHMSLFTGQKSEARAAEFIGEN